MSEKENGCSGATRRTNDITDRQILYLPEEAGGKEKNVGE